MIDPVKSAAQIILNDPDLAVELFDLMLKAVEPGFKDSGEFDDILDMCWLKITDSREARDKYARDRAA